MKADDRIIAIALSLCPSLERQSLRKLIDACGGPVAVWEAHPSEWQQACRLRSDTVAQLDRWRRNMKPSSVEQRIAHLGLHSVVQGDSNYPSPLLDLHDPPLVLFSSGEIDIGMFDQTVSIVGTRRASGYALEATMWISETLAHHGFNVVSGLALGVDGAAHQGALQAGGMTTAVLASGVDVCYPPHHRQLYEDVLNRGMVVSEYPPGATVSKWRFPERNRLIAALSSRLIVVQAGDKSGALRTVDSALELGRDVYVVPGPITSVHFRGSNRLIQQGSEVLLDPLDLVIQVTGSATPTGVINVPERWRELYEAMDGVVASVVLANTLGKPLSHIYVGLLELELARLIVKLPGGMYAKATHP